MIGRNTRPSLVHAPRSHATRDGQHTGNLLVEPKGPFAAFESLSGGLGEVRGVWRETVGELADVIARQLVGTSAAASGSLSLVYNAVEDKNWHWHNRYRSSLPRHRKPW